MSLIVFDFSLYDYDYQLNNLIKYTNLLLIIMIIEVEPYYSADPPIAKSTTVVLHMYSIIEYDKCTVL